MMQNVKENIYEKLLLLCASSSVAVLLLIVIFISFCGFPIIMEIGLKEFVFGITWEPSLRSFGILPMLEGTIITTFGALIISVPLSVFTAIFLVEFAPLKIAKIISQAVELLAGIPSVIYGLFGMTMIIPVIQVVEKKFFTHKVSSQPQSGYGILAVVIILSIMIAPTIINISKDALKSVPQELKEGSLALGATHWQTVEYIVVPSAKSGILASVILGMGRAIGETMAVIMVAGNTVQLPKSIFSPVRTLTSNIAVEIAYAEAGAHTQALFATGIVLFMLIIIINSIVICFMGKRAKLK
jgi:phosphate transport system permease protein